MRAALLCLALSLVTTACWTANARLPGTLRNDDVNTESVGQLNIEKTNYFFILGLLNKPSDDFLAEDIRQAVRAAKGDGVTGLTYEAQFGCLDLIITQLTFGCVTPRSYRATGKIVRIKNAPLPGKSAGVEVAPAAERLAQGY